MSIYDVEVLGLDEFVQLFEWHNAVFDAAQKVGADLLKMPANDALPFAL